jgi:hypothetical protein
MIHLDWGRARSAFNIHSPKHGALVAFNEVQKYASAWSEVLWPCR